MASPRCLAKPVETVIFVDVDGVLNVGARSLDDSPLLVDQWNLRHAAAMRDRSDLPHIDQDCMERLLSVSEREIGRGEAGRYGKFACGQDHVSELLAARLAQIIQKAGPGRHVVLSSNWRRPERANEVRHLEAEVSRHLGGPFTFDARTADAEERSAGDRLRCIGDYLEKLCGSADAQRPSPQKALKKALKVLVLDDFFITPLSGWQCDGLSVQSALSVEIYLRGRAPHVRNLEVKLVHTYDEWLTPKGVQVAIGAGLTQEQLRQAEEFVAGPIAAPGPQKTVNSPRSLSKAVNSMLLPCKSRKIPAWPWLSIHLPVNCF